MKQIDSKFGECRQKKMDSSYLILCLIFYPLSSRTPWSANSATNSSGPRPGWTTTPWLNTQSRYTAAFLYWQFLPNPNFVATFAPTSKERGIVFLRRHTDRVSQCKAIQKSCASDRLRSRSRHAQSQLSLRLERGVACGAAARSYAGC